MTPVGLLLRRSVSPVFVSWMNTSCTLLVSGPSKFVA